MAFVPQARLAWGICPAGAPERFLRLVKSSLVIHDFTHRRLPFFFCWEMAQTAHALECRYCHKKGHVIVTCPRLARKLDKEAAASLEEQFGALGVGAAPRSGLRRGRGGREGARGVRAPRGPSVVQLEDLEPPPGLRGHWAPRDEFEMDASSSLGVYQCGTDSCDGKKWYSAGWARALAAHGGGTQRRQSPRDAMTYCVAQLYSLFRASKSWAKPPPRSRSTSLACSYGHGYTCRCSP